jgi:class 3 adenylate cyclase
MVALNRGRIDEAMQQARSALQAAGDAGHQKQRWRSQVLLAHALAENLQADEAAGLMPPISTRIEGQDVIYDIAPRISTLLAQGRHEEAIELARSTPNDIGDVGSIAEAISTVGRDDPSWLRSYLDSLASPGELQNSPRLRVARGRLALYDGRVAEAVHELKLAVAAFVDGGLLLDAWHAGRSLAEAEARSGDEEGAQRRLTSIVSDAEAAGARLAARLAQTTAERLGFAVRESLRSTADVQTTRRIAPGERMVSVLFADVRGFTELSGHASPADMSDNIAALQRWAALEVSRRHGILDKFAGDAIMATFNVSGQSVDHALQALRSAIAIIDKASLAGLPVGAGIAVGPAVVGTFAESANVSVLGDATNLAARLQAQSGAGEVTLSEEAHRRVKDWLDGQRMGSQAVELDLKGYSEPVTAFKVRTTVVEPAPI